MREKYQGHSRFVGDWLDKAGRRLDNEKLLDLLALAVAALWSAARISISDVTLDAVLERVVINGRHHFRWLPVLPVVHSNIDTSVWRAQCARTKHDDMVKAVRFLVTEFLAINANLTAEALSPGMHRALGKVRWKKKIQAKKSTGAKTK